MGMAARCERVQALLPRLAAGTLPASVESFVRAHVEGCAACRRVREADEQLRVHTVISRPQPCQVALPARTLLLARPATASVVDTPLGWQGVCWTDLGLALISPPCAERQQAHRTMEIALVAAAVSWQEVPEGLGSRASQKLRGYLNGNAVRFDEPVDLSALPPFQRQVLAVTRTIPYGATRPYGWIAQRLGRPGAARAVGQALHYNPLAPVIPCHRVVGAGGSLTGYAWGLPVKRWLLEMERCRTRLC